MNLGTILLLAVVQGVAELLPVSSSAHVIIAEKLLGLDPTAPRMTFLLVMLHTGTMFAVIGYFWRTWHERYFSSVTAFRDQAGLIATATAATGVVGLLLMWFIERVVLAGSGHAEVEQLFGNRYLLAAGLAAAGLLIFASGRLRETPRVQPLHWRQAIWIGAVQGLCLPFRGFSRSGATISTGLVLGLERLRAEEFSFALAVVLTPAVVVKEAHRLLKVAALGGGAQDLTGMYAPGFIGMLLSFCAGWLALRWLSSWLEHGLWHLFGYYCLAVSAFVLLVLR